MNIYRRRAEMWTFSQMAEVPVVTNDVKLRFVGSLICFSIKNVVVSVLVLLKQFRYKSLFRKQSEEQRLEKRTCRRGPYIIVRK